MNSRYQAAREDLFQAQMTDTLGLVVRSIYVGVQLTVYIWALAALFILTLAIIRFWSEVWPWLIVLGVLAVIQGIRRYLASSEASLSRVHRFLEPLLTPQEWRNFREYWHNWEVYADPGDEPKLPYEAWNAVDPWWERDIEKGVNPWYAAEDFMKRNPARFLEFVKSFTF